MKKIKTIGNKTLSYKLQAFIFAFFFLFSFITTAQVTTQIDTTKIRIGEQISYKIKVETDSTNLVVFPEGQTFLPLELVEALTVDTTKQASKFQLLREYKLTKFDSGAFYIPKQKIVIGDKTVFTDSLQVEVNTIEVDTTKQGLYDIKPIIEVEKSSSKWWLYVLITLLILGLVGFLLYWFIWRKKPLSEEEKIALLPPYDRAKLALKNLDEAKLLERSEIKKYYSELTFIIRKFLDEKVYDRAMESTTDQLIGRLELIKEGNQLAITKETITNIENILKRADLVKFAKSTPDVALAQMDKQTVDKEIDAVKVTLPEPSEEEKLLNEKYKEAQERKKKRRKIWLTVGISVFLLIATFVGFGIKYGFAFVKDTIIGHESKELLEGNWVKSAYGIPPIYIETPKVLKRTAIELPEELKENVEMTTFIYGTLLDQFSVSVNTSRYKQQPAPQQAQGQDAQQAPQIDLLQVAENAIKGMENEGAQNIAVKRDKFITPNNAEGLKTFGALTYTVPNTSLTFKAEYAMFHFTSENVLQQIIITWPEDDVYADKIAERIINSIELNPNTESEEDPK